MACDIGGHVTSTAPRLVAASATKRVDAVFRRSMAHVAECPIHEPSCPAQRRLLATPGSFAMHGDADLRQFLEASLKNLTPEARDALRASVAKEAALPRMVGTMCSGTDCPILVYKSYLAALHNLGFGGFQYRHEFACDQSSLSQRFIKRVFRVPRFFRTAHEVARGVMSDGGAYDWVSEKVQAVPRVNDLLAGFPCKDVSGLNGAACNHRAVCVGDQAAKGGHTAGPFHDIVSYAASVSSLKSMLLENVVGLAAKDKESDRSNLDFCAAHLARHGWHLHCWRLGPRLFGCPVSRPRLWMMVLRMADIEAAGVSLDGVTKIANEAMQACVQGEIRHLDDFLFQEDHQEIIDMMRQAQSSAKISSSASSAPASAQKWVQQYMEACDTSNSRKRSRARHDMETRGFSRKDAGPTPPEFWEPIHPNAEVASLFPGVLALSDRQLSVLATWGVRVNNLTDIAEREPRVVNVGMTSQYARPSALGESGCVTPTGELFLAHRLRKVSGHESMFLQGMHFGEAESAVSSFETVETQELAGNAFHVYCCAAAFLSKEVVVALMKAAVRASRPPLMRMSNADSCSESDCE